MTNQIDVLAIAREAGFRLACDWYASSDYLCDECDILKFASAILERAAVECERSRDFCSDTAQSHEEDSPSRDRMTARAREAMYCAQDIRALKPQQENPCN